MIERRLELKINTPVCAKDGNCGRIQQLVIDPHQKKVIGLVVKHDLLSKTAFTIPIEQVADVSETEVRLRLYRQQVFSLPEYKEDFPLLLGSQCYLVDKHEFVTSSSAGIEILRTPTSNEPGMVESQIFDESKFPLAINIQPGQNVFCKAGRAGRVQLLLLDPSGKINGFVMRTEGRHHHDFIVPVDLITEVDQINVHLSVEKQAVEKLEEYVPDNVLAGEINNAIWENKALWVTQFSEISATVQDGIVTLRGHVPTSFDKSLIENAVRPVAGLLGIENQLVADDDLTILVAEALGRDERTRPAMISVNTRTGIVTLSGRVESAAIQGAAEEIAAAVPSVRGVMNYIQAPDVMVDPVEDRFLQPLIDQKVQAIDILLGTVEKVIINPHNRRVTDFVVYGNFANTKIDSSSRLENEESLQERWVILPSRLIRYAIDSTIFLDSNGVEAANYGDYNAAQFASPPDDWQPPYPYCQKDVLFKKQSEIKVCNDSSSGLFLKREE